MGGAFSVGALVIVSESETWARVTAVGVPAAADLEMRKAICGGVGGGSLATLRTESDGALGASLVLCTCRQSVLSCAHGTDLSGISPGDRD